MKTLITFLILLLKLNLVFAEGGCGGHGGDGYSLEFYRLGKHLAQEFKNWPQETFSKLSVKFNPDEFENVVEMTRIVSLEQPLILNSAPVDAINYTNGKMPLIEVNRSRWDSYADQRFRKLGIVLHEYLGIAKGIYGHVEWDHYSLSVDLLKLYERKTKIDALFLHETKLKEFIHNFKKSTPFHPIDSKKISSYSCIEYSALANDSSKFTHLDAFRMNHLKNYGDWHPEAVQQSTSNSLMRQWADQDPTEAIDKPASIIKEFIRESSNGDLITEVTTDYLYSNQTPSLVDPTRGVLSYFYCSKLGSKSLDMTKFMFDSLSPIFDLPLQPDFSRYVEQIKELANSKTNKSCTALKKRACESLYRKLDKITLPSETKRINDSKVNIESINVWLNSLSDSDNAFAFKPISKLFDKYVNHQMYLSSLLDLNDPTPYSRDPGLINFAQSLESRIPLSYKASKLTFGLELKEIQIEYIKNFVIR